MSKLLLPEQPLVVLPQLAKTIGLNEAIIIQQMHYWLLTSKHIYDGHAWVYNTYAEWQEQFPFWSESTIKRTIKSLEKQELIITGNYNKLQIDRTKWYRIDYDKLEEKEGVWSDQQVKMTRRTGQNDPSQQAKMTPPYQRLPKTTTEINLPPQKNSDYLEQVFNHNGKTSEATAPNPQDQWFEYSDKFIRLFHQKTGRYPNTDEKELISAFCSGGESTTPAQWEAALTECNLNYTGHRLTVQRVIEICRAGSWKDWLKETYPDKQESKATAIKADDEIGGFYA